jgi:hypothetical protein
VLIAIDETLERRKGRKIKAKGCYRDAVRSTEKKVVKCFGLKWICMSLIVPLPWNKRPWALPFLTILAPSKQANEARGRQHRTLVDWSCIMVCLVTRWLNKNWVLIGDGAYASIHLGQHCHKMGVTLISRLRLDAVLYEEPEPVPAGRSGRKPMKGKRIPSFKELIEDSTQTWWESEVAWYGGEKKSVYYLSGINFWYKPGEKPLPIRWVLVVDKEKPSRYEAFFSTDVSVEAEQIIEWFVLRWNIEVTFEEVRTHLGVETQRQWSDKAIGRTTPVLMGLYSVACLSVRELSQSISWQPASAAWYAKGDQCTFSDVMALIRRSIWSEKYFFDSASKANTIKLTTEECNSLIDLLAGAP